MTILLWSVLAIVARYAAHAIPTFSLIFLRFAFASIPFLPILMYYKTWQKPYFRRLMGVAMLATVNVISYLWGIKYTTATVSQMIYAAMPLIVLLVNVLVFHRRTSWYKVVGIGIGFTGLVYILVQSILDRGTSIAGTPLGNVLIITAMVSWTMYMIFSKEMTRHFSPLEIAAVSVLSSFFPTLILASWELVFVTHHFDHLMVGVMAAAYMGIFGTFIAYISYQYALKHTSALMTSLTNYIQPITTGILAMLILGERVTLGFIVGAFIVFSGIFMTTTVELYRKRD